MASTPTSSANTNKVQAISRTAITSTTRRTNPSPPRPGTVNTKPVSYKVTDISTDISSQQEAILDAYRSMAGTELFQYSNARSVDGEYSDVTFFNVLSQMRQINTPNRNIEMALVVVIDMWVEDGYLFVSISDDDNLWDSCMLSFIVGADVIVSTTTD
jgi:hypothetical protein